VGKFACERDHFPESFGTGLPLKVSVPSTMLSLLYLPLLACRFVLLLQFQLEGRRVKFVLASPVLTKEISCVATIEILSVARKEISSVATTKHLS
jgi:hypothetical protein